MNSYFQCFSIFFVFLLASNVLGDEQFPEKGVTEKSDRLLSAHAKSIPNIITERSPYLPDFSYAGYKNGNISLPSIDGKIFNVTDYGAIADDGKDDSESVLKAIEAAKAFDGPVVVKFPSGRFILSEILYIDRSDFAIQGVGLETTLFYPRPMRFLDTPPQLLELSEYLILNNKRQRERANNIDLPFSLYAWTGGYLWARVPGARGKAYLKEYDRPPDVLANVIEGVRGKLSVKVDDVGRLRVGDVIKLEWYNVEGRNSSLLKELYGDPTRFSTIGSHHWTNANRALVTQVTKILSMDGDQLQLADPLLIDANRDWKPKLVRWEHLENVSLSDFTMEFPNGVYIAHHVEEGYNGIYLEGVYDGFVRNIEIINADSGILTDDIANVTLEDITTSGPHRAHYTVHMGSVYNVLAKRVRVENTAEHPLSFNTYAVKSVYKDCEVLSYPILDQHSGANHQNLFDNIRVHLPFLDEDRTYPLFGGGGASYWKPSHGRFSTLYNIEVVTREEPHTDNVVTLKGPRDGVQSRLIGIYGNSPLEIQYGPDAHMEQINQKPRYTSLYDLQLKERQK